MKRSLHSRKLNIVLMSNKVHGNIFPIHDKPIPSKVRRAHTKYKDLRTNNLQEEGNEVGLYKEDDRGPSQSSKGKEISSFEESRAIPRCELLSHRVVESKIRSGKFRSFTPCCKKFSTPRCERFVTPRCDAYALLHRVLHKLAHCCVPG